MAVWHPFVLLGVFLAILVSESVLLYAATALGNVALKFNGWLLASSGAAVVWSAVGLGGAALVVFVGQSFALKGWAAVGTGGAVGSWLVLGLLFAWAFSTSVWRGMLVSAYLLLLRALAGLVVAGAAVLLLRSFLAASAFCCGRDRFV